MAGLTNTIASVTTVTNSSSSSGIGINAGFNALAPWLKPVEAAAAFQKIRTPLGQQELDNENLRFTYMDAKDFNLRPQANLFQSFRLPNTTVERATLRRKLVGTALAGLADIDKCIAIEIPRNKYGEMVDGKSIVVDIPQTSGGTFYSVKCHSSFYGFNPDLNTQISDANAVSSLFSGVEPTEENDYNTNVAYMFSNDVQAPLDNYYNFDMSQAESLTVNPGEIKPMATFTGPLVPGKTYQSSAIQLLLKAGYNIYFTTALGQLSFADTLEVSTSFSFRVKYQVTAISVQNLTSTAQTVFIALSELRPVSINVWSAWTSQNRFPTTNDRGVSGKVYGKLMDADYGVLVDPPVGIAYLDKGFILITHPTLVANFDLSEALTIDGNGVVSAYSQAPEDKTLFTNVFFPSTSTAGYRRSSLTYRSVVTEYNQGYTCLAMPNEFTETSNPTYRQAYPAGTGNAGQQPLLITEIGLYNKYGELVAIAKTTKPLEKTKTSVAVFNIGLKI